MIHTCPTCGDDFRKGKRVMVLDDVGGLSPRLVCLGCATRAVSVVTTARTTIVCGACSKNDATTCDACVNDAAHRAAQLVVKPYSEYLRKLAKGAAMAKGSSPSPDVSAGIALGLVQAADILDGNRAMPLPAAPEPPKPKSNGRLLEPPGDFFDPTEPPSDHVHTVSPSGRPIVAKLGKAERALLGVVAARTKPIDRRQLAVLTGYPYKKSAFKNAIGALRTLGYVQGPRDSITVTTSGKAAAPNAQHAPRSGPELLEHWRHKINMGSAVKMLEALVQLLPREPTREQLAEALEVEPDTSSFKNSLGRLRTLQLVSKDGFALAPEMAHGWPS
jgi:hypothetical protein